MNKVELKKQLQDLGIKVEGNNIRKKDIEAAISPKDDVANFFIPLLTTLEVFTKKVAVLKDKELLSAIQKFADVIKKKSDEFVEK